MTFHKYVAIVCSLVIGSCLLVYQFKDNTQPSLKIIPELIEIGTVPSNKSINVKAVLNNTSKSRIDILGMKSSCDCTVVTKRTFQVSPGESELLEFELMPPATAKPFQGALTVFYGSPVRTSQIKYRGNSLGNLNQAGN